MYNFSQLILKCGYWSVQVRRFCVCYFSMSGNYTVLAIEVVFLVIIAFMYLFELRKCKTFKYRTSILRLAFAGILFDMLPLWWLCISLEFYFYKFSFALITQTSP